jgi:cysteine desulfurase
MLRFPLYLDNAATTQVDPRVVDKMLPWLTGRFGNPASSSHVYGREARIAVETARAQVAQLIHCNADEVVWTSGATESDNLALKGAALAQRRTGGHLITVATEHKAVLDTMHELSSSGFELTCLQPDGNGILAPEKLRSAIRPDTVLASVMLVNNEIGVIQDIAAIGEICREHGVLFHVDAAQATGKVEIDVRRQCVDLMSLTAHKSYGPKGIGALYVRGGRRAGLAAQMHGGGHEAGLRSGTLATHQIVGMGECFRIAADEMAAEVPRMRAMREKLYHGLTALDGVRVNGDMQRRIANNLNISLDRPDAERIIASLTNIAISSAAACVSGAGAVSHVLQALGNNARLAANAIRITVGRFNTEEEIDYALDYLRRAIGGIEGLRRHA